MVSLEESKKSVIDFGLLVLCHSGRNPIDFLGYGRYCGKTPPWVHRPPLNELDR